ncbi:kinase-like domain-containing protein [Mycena epipterygia]|nr:kinase-like domain-containing protein [Mycena epipterygia]
MHDVIYVMWLCRKKPDFCQSLQITNLKIGSRLKNWPPGISRGKNFGGGFLSSLSKSGSGEHKFEPEIILDRATDHLRALFVHNCTLPQNLVMHTHAIMGRWPLWVETKSSMPMDILEHLTSYSSVVETLLNFQKQSYDSKVVQAPSSLLFIDAFAHEESHASTGHIISKDIHVHMSRDITVLVVRLVLFLCDPESSKRFLSCRGTDAQQLLDLLQNLLDHDTFSGVRSFLCKTLMRLSRASGLHPRCFALSGLQKVGQQVAAGGFGDIWKGLVRGQSVSVKIMRLFQDADVEAVLKEFGREALIWRQLCHPNLLPFFGLYYLENRLCLVSPWMENGNILQFLSKDSQSTDRISLILDVALGLEYLHEEQVVHGDLKGINILVTPSHRACIADFGLSSIVNAITLRFTHSTASARGGTTRYQAPELLRGESENHFGSDVYGFACVCYEILTGKAPFYEVFNDAAVMFKVLGGARPSCPTSCSGTKSLDSLWELLQDCWKEEPETRPTAVQIVERLKGPLIQATTTQSTTDWDEKFTCKFRRSLQAQPLLPSITQIERKIFGDGLF